MTLPSGFHWRAVALTASIAVALASASVRLSGTQRSADPSGVAGPLKLYTFLMGTILTPDLAPFGLKSSEVSIDRMGALAFLIVHPQGTLLWESGVVPNEWVGSSRPEAERAMKSLSHHLGDIGFSYRGITHFAMSHAHSDHAGDANALAGATWLVQRAERDAMFASPPYAGARADFYTALAKSKTILIDGDHDVFGDGRVVLKAAPGHTPGHQVLFVNLPNTGPVVLAGDLYHFAEQRTHGRLAPIDMDPQQAQASRAAIEAFVKQMGAQLWIQHDYRANFRRLQSPAYYD